MLPPEVLNPPELEPEHCIIITAFYDLINDRPMFMGGIGGIYWSSMVAYTDRLGVDGDVAEYIMTGIRIADSEYLAYTSKKTAEIKSQGGRGAAPRRKIPKHRNAPRRK